MQQAQAQRWYIVDPDSNTVLNIVMAYDRTDAMIGVDLKTYPHALAFTYAEYLALDPMPTW